MVTCCINRCSESLSGNRFWSIVACFTSTWHKFSKKSAHYTIYDIGWRESGFWKNSGKLSSVSQAPGKISQKSQFAPLITLWSNDRAEISRNFRKSNDDRAELRISRESSPATHTATHTQHTLQHTSNDDRADF